MSIPSNKDERIMDVLSHRLLTKPTTCSEDFSQDSRVRAARWSER